MVYPADDIRLRSSARSNTGRVRDNNEDRVHLFAHDHIVIAIVADGMGGAVAGEEASRIAVEKIHQGLMDSDRKFPEGYADLDLADVAERMKQIINVANNKIVQASEHQPELKGMGTTVTMSFIRDTEAVIGHVGDSRAYLITGNDGKIEQVTSDHSFVQALVGAGHITKEEADKHPMRNVLYRALGQGDDVEVDIYHQTLHIGDRLVLCSDGLTLHVNAQEIAQVVLASKNPSEASQKLIDKANERGGRDNVSAIVIHVDRIDPDLTDMEDIHTDYDYLDEDTLILNQRPTHLDDVDLPEPSGEDPRKTTLTLEQTAVVLHDEDDRTPTRSDHSNESNIDISGEGQDQSRQ